MQSDRQEQVQLFKKHQEATLGKWEVSAVQEAESGSRQDQRHRQELNVHDFVEPS